MSARKKRAPTVKQSKISGAPHPGVENLKPFKPGQSGNPNGRPKRKTLTERIADLLDRRALAGLDVPDGECVADLLAREIVLQACLGRFPYSKEVLDRIDGKVPERLAGHDGGPLNLGVDLTPLDDDDLDHLRTITGKLLRGDIVVDADAPAAD